jgi:hypothetical protein
MLRLAQQEWHNGIKVKDKRQKSQDKSKKYIDAVCWYLDCKTVK